VNTNVLGLALLGIGLVVGLRLVIGLRRPQPADVLPARSSAAGILDRLRRCWVGFHAVARQHPARPLAYAETAAWLLVLLSLVDHVLSYRGFTAALIWYLTIGPHEIGHLICLPFGQLLYIAGGSIWQVLAWVLLGVYSLLARRQISVTLFFWAVAGHSLVNLAQYIGDARARQLPLLFGQSAEHHDWYNLLNMLGLLNADKTLAVLATLVGIVTVVSVVVVGILSAWLLPRTRLGRVQRFDGSPLRALSGVLAQTFGQG
jgi:hypothetical protein